MGSTHFHRNLPSSERLRKSHAPFACCSDPLARKLRSAAKEGHKSSNRLRRSLTPFPSIHLSWSDRRSPTTHFPTNIPVMVRSKGSWSHPTFETPAVAKTARATRSKQRLEGCRADAVCHGSRGSTSPSRPNTFVREGARDSRESISSAHRPTEKYALGRSPAINTGGAW